MITKIKNNKLFIEIDVKDKKLNNRILSYLNSIETCSKSKASDKDIKKISDEITMNWWLKNKNRLLK